MDIGSERFEARPDPQCQRGLLVRYAIRGVFDHDRLARSLQTVWSDSLVEVSERWGRRSVRRLVRQFCFEVRIGDRDDEISFLHRALASPAQRAEQTEVFERCLRAELETAAAPS